MRLPGTHGTELVTGREGAGSGEPFVFLSVFKWELRKGWDILLRAFVEEFKVGGGRLQGARMNGVQGARSREQGSTTATRCNVEGTERRE